MGLNKFNNNPEVNLVDRVTYFLLSDVNASRAKTANNLSALMLSFCSKPFNQLSAS